jgi:hypothetical protein
MIPTVIEQSGRGERAFDIIPFIAGADYFLWRRR